MLDDNLPEENQTPNEPKALNQSPRMAVLMPPTMPPNAPSESSTPVNETPPLGPSPMSSAEPTFNQPQPPPARSIEPSSMHETIDQPRMSSSTPLSNLRGFWKLFADAWHSYWPHFWTFVKLNLLTVVIMLIPILLTMAAIPLGFSGSGGLAIVGIILGVIVLAFVIIFMLRIITANIVLACRIAAGKEKIGIWDLLKIAKHNVGKIIGVAILAGLTVMAGQILFVIPGLIFLTWFSLAAFVVVFEDLGVIKSMGRSYNLIKGYGWETFYLLAGITLLTGLLGLLVQVAGGAGLIFGLLFGAALGGGAAGTIAGLGTAILVALIFAGLVSLLAPIWEIMPAMRYLDLKNIKDNGLPKTESTAKAVTISLILGLIWTPLIGWGMWANYQELTGKRTKIQPSKDNINDILKDIQPTTENTEEKSFEEQMKSKEQEKIPPVDTDETANWPTYNNEDYGFSFKYPTDWKVEKGALSDLFLSHRDSETHPIINVIKINVKQGIMQNVGIGRRISEKQIIFNNITWQIVYDQYLVGESVTTAAFYDQDKDLTYVVSAWYRKEKGELFEKVLNQILSTFKLH